MGRCRCGVIEYIRSFIPFMVHQCFDSTLSRVSGNLSSRRNNSVYFVYYGLTTVEPEFDAYGLYLGRTSGRNVAHCMM